MNYKYFVKYIFCFIIIHKDLKGSRNEFMLKWKVKYCTLFQKKKRKSFYPKPKHRAIFHVKELLHFSREPSGRQPPSDLLPLSSPASISADSSRDSAEEQRKAAAFYLAPSDFPVPGAPYEVTSSPETHARAKHSKFLSNLGSGVRFCEIEHNQSTFGFLFGKI